MKALVLGLMILSSVPSYASTESLFCALDHAKEAIKKAKAHSTYDKNRHCSVSCLLTLKCNPTEVLMVGVLKEIADMFDHGDPDIEDIKADRMGIRAVTTGRAHNEAECFEQCDSYYHVAP